jgi:hypothetical protein
MNVNSLEAWLDIATRGLCDAAKERVRAEVAQHFNSTKETFIRDGLDETSAIVNALESLGNANHARKRFNRFYLTAQQFGLIRAIADGHTKTFRLLFLGMYVLGLTSFAYLVQTSNSRYDAWEAFGQFLSSLMWGSMAFSAFLGRRHLRFSIALLGLSFPLSMAGILMKWTANKLSEGKSVFEPFGIVLFILAVVFLLTSAYECASVLIKLRRRHNREIAGI